MTTEQPIKGRVFKKIHKWTSRVFWAEYKGMDITIEWMASGLYNNCWNIEVRNLDNGMRDVDTLRTREECPTIIDALKYALEGAML